MEPKIVTNEKDIEDLKFGDAYVIVPEGLPDSSTRNPNIPNRVLREIDRLQDLVETKFKENPPTKEEKDDFDKRMKEGEEDDEDE